MDEHEELLKLKEAKILSENKIKAAQDKMKADRERRLSRGFWWKGQELSEGVFERSIIDAETVKLKELEDLINSAEIKLLKDQNALRLRWNSLGARNLDAKAAEIIQTRTMEVEEMRIEVSQNRIKDYEAIINSEKAKAR
jgi:hypothetical protein